MIFLKLRIRKLQEKVDIQRLYVDKLEKTAQEYGQSYYTDRLLEEYRKWLEMNSKLMWMKEQVK